MCVTQVIGILVCFFGLSAGVLAEVYKGFCDNDVATLLGVLAFGIPAVSLVASLCMRLKPSEPAARHTQRSDSASHRATSLEMSTPGEPAPPLFSKLQYEVRTRGALIVVVLIIAVIGASSITNAVSPTSPPFGFAVAAVALLGLYIALPACPLGVVAAATAPCRPSSAEPSPSGVGAVAVAPDATPLLDADNSKPREHGTSLNLIETMQTLDYWLIFVAFMCCIGASISSLDNLDRIVDSKSTAAAGATLNTIKVGATVVVSWSHAR